MPVSFGGVPAKPPAAPATPPANTPQPGTMAPQQPAQGGAMGFGHQPPQQQKPASPLPSGAPGVGFLMTGADAHQALQHEEAKAAAAQAENGKLWRFYISQKHVGVDYSITFLDGGLGPDGLLQMVSWYEHSFMVDKRLQHFACTSAHEPCPMCAQGDERELMFGFTIMDHTPHTIKGGPKAGTVIPQSRKLFVCKKKTASQLQLIASKIGGLQGAHMTVIRSGNMSPNVGDTFFPIHRYTPQEMLEQFGEEATPADWSHELTYRTADELVGLGIAEAMKTVDQKGTGFGGAPKTNNFASNF